MSAKISIIFFDFVRLYHFAQIFGCCFGDFDKEMGGWREAPLSKGAVTRSVTGGFFFNFHNESLHRLRRSPSL